MRRTLLPLAIAGLFVPAAWPYIRRYINPGVYLSRPDFAKVQFLVNQDFVPGLTNSMGQVVVTGDSNVKGAISAAMAAWNSIAASAARFAPVQTTTLVNSPNDGNNVIVFLDTPAIRSMLGPDLTALTVVAADASSGTILDSDIIFNPAFSFSTTGAPKTYDIQSVFTKQFGNSLGAANGAVIGGALFVFSAPNETIKQVLSQDDVAFAIGVYPAAAASTTYGTLKGTLTLNGAPLKNGLVTAVDTSGSGIALSTLSSEADGTWAMAAPPARYMVYTQPLLGQPDLPTYDILPNYIGLNSSNTVDTNFQASFLGGNGSAGTVTVKPGAAADASFSPSADSNPPALGLVSFEAVSVGATANVTIGTPHATEVTSGASYDFVIQGPGIDSLAESDIQLLGPLKLRSGTLKQSTGAIVNGVSLPLVRFTVDTTLVTAQTTATLIVSKSGNFTSYTGGIVLVPPPNLAIVSAATNGASFTPGEPLAPGSLASLFGIGLAAGGGDASTIPLPLSLGGASVTVGGIPAPLLFVSSKQINLQVPWNVTGPTAKVVVTVNKTPLSSFTANIGPFSPGIFTTQSGTGPALAINPDGSLAAPVGAIPGMASHPANVGDPLAILGTGLGDVTPAGITGSASTGTQRNTNTVPKVLIGGVDAQVTFSGLSPQFVGLNQVNVVVPAVQSGVVPLQFEIGGITTSNLVTIAVTQP